MLFDILDPTPFYYNFGPTPFYYNFQCYFFIFSGVRGTILAGGDCCSRNLFVGACLAARGGVKVSSRNILGGGAGLAARVRNKD